MSQAQSQSKPPPLREVLFQAEAEEKAKDKDQFYDELYAAEASDASPPPAEEPPPPSEPETAPLAPASIEVRSGNRRTDKAAEEPLPRQEPAPAPIEARGGYRRTDDNVYQIDGLWQKAPVHQFTRGRTPPVRVLRGVPSTSLSRSTTVSAGPSRPCLR